MPAPAPGWFYYGALGVSFPFLGWDCGVLNAFVGGGLSTDELGTILREGEHRHTPDGAPLSLFIFITSGTVF